MKTRFLSGLKFLMVMGGWVILLGCGNGATKAFAQTKSETIPNNTTIINNSSDSVSTNAVVVKDAIAIPQKLSPGLAEIIKLSQSNVSEEVLLAYIANADFAFNPSADEILYLTDLGIPDKIITAIVNQKSTVAATTSAQENVATNVSAAPPIVTGPLTPSGASVPQVTQVVAPAEPVTINNFYDTLSPYGNWVEVAEYGLCWQPAVVVVDINWRPYCDRGRWIYTDCGWYWQSDYSWGWAPFHYGRWYRDYRHGWVWMPDSTWGPSWVSWRYSSDYCGWAPLPPAACYRSGFGFSFYDQNVSVSFEFGLRDDCYTFVPSRRFYDRYPSHYAVSQSYNKTVYNNTTVNNYYGYNNNTVINHGIAPERIASATGSKIEKVAVREMPAKSSGSNMPKPDRVAKSGNSLVVYRPSNIASVPNANSPQVNSAQKNPRAPERKQNAGVEKTSAENFSPSATPQANRGARTQSGTIFTPEIGTRSANSDSRKDAKNNFNVNPAASDKREEKTKLFSSQVAGNFQKPIVKNAPVQNAVAPDIETSPVLKSLPSPVSQPKNPRFNDSLNQNKAQANSASPQNAFPKALETQSSINRPQKSVERSVTPQPAQSAQPIFSQNSSGNSQARPQKNVERSATPQPAQSAQPIFSQNPSGSFQLRPQRSLPSASVPNYQAPQAQPNPRRIEAAPSISTPSYQAPQSEPAPRRIESAPSVAPSIPSVVRSQPAPASVPSYRPSPVAAPNIQSAPRAQPVQVSVPSPGPSPAAVPMARPQQVPSAPHSVQSQAPAVHQSSAPRSIQAKEDRPENKK